MSDETVEVIVGAVDVGEADRIVRTLSAQRGRSSVVARNARSSRRRFAGMFELGNRVQIRRSSRRGGLDVVSDADLVSAPRRARAELDRIALLAYGVELCAALSPEEHPSPKLARLLEVWLDALEAEHAPAGAGRVALEAKALTFAGLAPALTRCAACGDGLEPPLVFDAEQGGALHARCGGGRPVEIQRLRWYEALRRAPLADSITLRAPEGTRADWLLSDFARHQVGRDLKSRRLLEELSILGDGR